jgi:hypothetical protein
MKKQSEWFGIEIRFGEVLHDTIYFQNKIENKLYAPVDDSLKEAEIKQGEDYQNIYQHSFRKIIFNKLEKPEIGIIIGQTTRDEGEYNPGYKGSWPDGGESEPAYLKLIKRYSFWIVATSLNVTKLVPKDSNIMIINTIK